MNLLGTNDVAKLTGVTPEAVRNWERLGKLPAERTPSGVRIFRREDVEVLIRERRKSEARALAD